MEKNRVLNHLVNHSPSLFDASGTETPKSCIPTIYVTKY